MEDTAGTQHLYFLITYLNCTNQTWFVNAMSLDFFCAVRKDSIVFTRTESIKEYINKRGQPKSGNVFLSHLSCP
jgi:hypothetical protein